MTDPMPAIYDALGWPEKLRPAEPEHLVALDADGAALGINWEGIVLDRVSPSRKLT